MAFYQHLVKTKVIDLKSTDKTDALSELAKIILKARRVKKHKPVIDDMLRREEAASTFIGQGLAIPIAKLSMRSDYAIVIGRSKTGISYDAARGAKVHIIVLVLAKDAECSDAIDIRSEIATFFKADDVQEMIINNADVDILEFVSSYSSETKKRGTVVSSKGGRRKGDPVIASACSLAKDIKASALVFLADAVRENDFLNYIKIKTKIIVITSNKSRFDENDKRFTEIIQAPSFPSSRTGQIKIGILLAVSRNLITKNDIAVCVSGNNNDGFDTIVVLDVKKEYQFFLSTATRSILPPDVKPEVLERVLGLASEIAVEGREGKPTGTIFVLGDTNSVNVFVRQLIINPFRGYTELERNVLDPGLDETIKEFSVIDGAFIITGGGIILSAGSYLRPPIEDIEGIDKLPSGFGARHQAAAAITVCTNAIAITISESTGMVSIFKNGTVMLTLAKPVPRAKSLNKTQLINL